MFWRRAIDLPPLPPIEALVATTDEEQDDTDTDLFDNPDWLLNLPREEDDQ